MLTGPAGWPMIAAGPEKTRTGDGTDEPAQDLKRDTRGVLGRTSARGRAADGARIGPIRPVGMPKPTWLFHRWAFVGRGQGGALNHSVEVAMAASEWPPSVAAT